MSWLARSLAKSLQIDEEFPNDRTSTSNDSKQNHLQSVQEFDSDQRGSNSQTLSGVQEDLSEFTESLSRQIWGVASFLAPPAPTRRSSTTTTESDRHRQNSGNGDDDVLNSICEESKFGDEIVVSNSSIEDQKEKDTGYVGVTDEVLVFAMNIAHHPETWLDFPLSEEEEDSDDFAMSDMQWNHVTLVERLVPGLAALRIELCPIHMSESYFWKVYFVLLHPRLNKHDAHLLSTPQIVAARAMWMKELQKQMKPGPESFESHVLDSHEDYNTTSSDSPSAANVSEGIPRAFEPSVSEKQSVLTEEDRSTIDLSDQRVVSSFTVPIEDFGDDEDDWIHENSELDGYDGPDVPIGAEEDISFSDLEDDDYMKIHHDVK